MVALSFLVTAGVIGSLLYFLPESSEEKMSGGLLRG